MNRKIMLLALAAISAVVFALPATASASESLHLDPTPEGEQTIEDVGANPKLTTTGGSTIECETFHGSATFEEGGTTGVMTLKFSGNCKSSGFSCKSTGSEVSGTIETTKLPFHLVTLPNKKPGVLVTPSADGSFAHVECAGGLVKFTVSGNGVIGTITQPACETESSDATIDFNATANGVQEHKKVNNTATEYGLTKSGENAAQDATGTLTLNEEAKLTCT